MNEKERTQEEQPLATELLSMVKSQNKRQSAIIVILIFLLAVTNAYHIYQWSQFDTVVVESGENGAPANYIEGDNNKGVVYGTGIGTEEKESKQK